MLTGKSACSTNVVLSRFLMCIYPENIIFLVFPPFYKKKKLFILISNLPVHFIICLSFLILLRHHDVNDDAKKT